MTYDEVCSKAQQVVPNREHLSELVKDMTLMERATFVQSLAAHVDFLTICIYRENHPNE